MEKTQRSPSSAADEKTTNTTDPNPWDIIAKYPTNCNAHESSWWKDVGPLLGRLLQLADYSVHQQYEYLLFARNHIVPSLGPYPQRWPSVMTYTDLPIEMSINFQDGKKSNVRVSFEPICELSGTPRDRFNQVAAEQLVAGLSALGPGLDRVLYHHFARDFGISESETRKLNAEAFVRHSVQSVYNFGCDFQHTGPVFKAYVYTGLKRRISGNPMRRVLGESLGRLDAMTGRGDGEAGRMVVDYMEEGGGFNEYMYLAWDFVDAAHARVKVYGVQTDLSLRKVEEVWTMGGRLKDPVTLCGLGLVRRLWGMLEGDGLGDGSVSEGEGEAGSQAKEPPLHTAEIFMWNYEIRPGCGTPIQKVYLPLLGKNDLFVAKALAKFFHSLGWTDKARAYVDNVRYLFPDENLSQSARLHVWVSLAYSEKSGAYMSVYYHSSLA